MINPEKKIYDVKIFTFQLIGFEDHVASKTKQLKANLAFHTAAQFLVIIRIQCEFFRVQTNTYNTFFASMINVRSVHLKFKMGTH